MLSHEGEGDSMIENHFKEAVRIFVLIFTLLGLSYLFKLINPEKEEEVPVVYLPGISGSQENRDVDLMINEIEKIQGLTVREELELVKERLEKQKEAANIATAAVVKGYQASIKMQDEMNRKMQQVIPEVSKDDRFICTTVWNYNYSKEDVLLLGDVIWAEVESFCDDEDGEYVAKVTGSVILHRVAAKSYYPNTVYDVVYQGEGTKTQQYASRTLKAIGNTNTPDYVYKWAEDILRDGPIGPANLVFQDNKAHGPIWLQYKEMYYCLSN